MIRKEFERTAPEAVGIPSKSIEKLLDALCSGFTEMHGIMIMRHGKICAEGWWAPYGPGIRHGCQSLTKTYAATAVGIAYTKGLLSLEDKIVDIFKDEAPKNPSENLKKLRVKDVLCMGCGMETMPHPSEDWIREFLETPVVHEPGSAFMYNSTGSTLLGAIVRKITGIGLHDWLKLHLFDTIGIDSDNLLWFNMPDGMEIGGGGLFSTTEDNLRLMTLYSQNGIWDGERILAEDYVNLATTKQIDSASEEAVNPPAKDNFLGYGYQMWMCRPKGAYRADGAMGQFSIVFPEYDMIISINETASGAIWAQKTLDTIYDIFLPEIKKDALPENKADAKALKKRLKALSIPTPDFMPYSDTIKYIDGKNYKVTNGALSLRMKSFFAPSSDDDKIYEFRFEFSVNECKMTIIEAEKEKTLLIGTDGVRRRNIVSPINSPVTELYLSGAWVTKNKFTILARWVETCFEMSYIFEFIESKVKITSEHSVGGLGPLFEKEEEPDIIAEAN